MSSVPYFDRYRRQQQIGNMDITTTMKSTASIYVPNSPGGNSGGATAESFAALSVAADGDLVSNCLFWP